MVNYYPGIKVASRRAKYGGRLSSPKYAGRIVEALREAGDAVTAGSLGRLYGSDGHPNGRDSCREDF